MSDQSITVVLRFFLACGGGELRGVFGAAILTLFLSGTGCVSSERGELGSFSASQSPTETRSLALRGIEALEANDTELASKFMNAALKRDVKNSQLQMLNGLVYHLRALRNDATFFDLAREGYELAVQFDPGNWLARYYLGLLKLDRRKYREAQEVLAEAALFNEEDASLLYSLAVASYYARDPQFAAGVLHRLRELEPKTPRVLRASSIVSAALGDIENARRWKALYAALPGSKDARSLDRRLDDWARFHGEAGRLLSTSKRAGSSVINPGNGQIDGNFQLAQLQGDNDQREGGSEGGSSENEAVRDGDDPTTDVGGTENGDLKNISKMVIVDVVIISSVEDNSTAMGVNLLDGLTLQFGSADNPAFGMTRNIVRDTLNGASAETTSIVRALTIPKITYSLNVANAGTNRNEILARPSLVASEGQQSEFFSGENIKASSVSKTSAESTASVDQDVGVKLSITPEQVLTEQVKMAVQVERTFLQAPSASVTFDNQIRTSKTTVTANLTLNRGETLILSGLSEKETELTRTGVPGLQEIPGLQYLFSRQSTRDFNRSVLLLITPRAPEYTFRPQARSKGSLSNQEQSSDKALDELKGRYTDWFSPYPNWSSVFNHLQNNKLYREFRTGDVELEQWETQSTRDGRLKTMLNFLYY